VAFLAARYYDFKSYLSTISDCLVNFKDFVLFWKDKWGDRVLMEDFQRLFFFACQNKLVDL
jgi:hypothetical protein